MCETDSTLNVDPVHGYRGCCEYLLKLESISANSAAISPDPLHVQPCVFVYVWTAQTK